ncbi:hypothetical protein [Desertivirga xinjiangensis]|uniref:hypothetical protein n=1 Tax=Desertivirga xinjiangensis TaxID=539206 RepID=UPI002109FB76|nr:hypothetical protein [Pedobacter xinjiangensis]
MKASEIPPKNTSFLFACKENYFAGILPADIKGKEAEGYKTVVQIAKSYFEANMYDQLAEYISESRYLIRLWSAYLILEYGRPEPDLRARCLEIIKVYLQSDSVSEEALGLGEWYRNYLKSDLI